MNKNFLQSWVFIASIVIFIIFFGGLIIYIVTAAVKSEKKWKAKDEVAKELEKATKKPFSQSAAEELLKDIGQKTKKSRVLKVLFICLFTIVDIALFFVYLFSTNIESDGNFPSAPYDVVGPVCLILFFGSLISLLISSFVKWTRDMKALKEADMVLNGVVFRIKTHYGEVSYRYSVFVAVPNIPKLLRVESNEEFSRGDQLQVKFNLKRPFFCEVVEKY